MDENNYTMFSQLTNLNENILESDNFVDDFDWSKDLEKYLKFAEEQQNIQRSSTFNQPRPILSPSTTAKTDCVEDDFDVDSFFIQENIEETEVQRILQDSSSEINKFIDDNKARATKRKTNTDLRQWYRFCESIGERRKMEDIPPEELNVILCHYLMKVKKHNGDEYEPDTLKSHLASFDRYLQDLGLSKEYSLFSNPVFHKVNEVLAKKRRQLRQMGKGLKPNKADMLTKEEIELLWNSGQLGSHNPRSLLNTVWFHFCSLFGWRGRDEHSKLKFGDVSLKKEATSERLEFLEWSVEKGSKTRTGESTAVRQFNPKIYATNDKRCPVKHFKAYLQHRPVEMCTDDAPFYLACIINPQSNVWYKRQAMGPSTLGSIMKNMASEAKIPKKRITNHSVRKTSISTLKHSNFDPLNIAQLSGHRNLKSLDDYSSASDEQQKAMSFAISNRLHGKHKVQQFTEAPPPPPVPAPSHSLSSCSSVLQDISNKPTIPSFKPTAKCTATNLSAMFENPIFHNCVFNLGTSSNCSPRNVDKAGKIPMPRKRRYVIYDSDED